MQVYSNPERENDEYALPDVEVFYARQGELCIDETGEPMDEGYYYWFCFPGCMPDSDPIGPFATESEAIDDAQEN